MKSEDIDPAHIMALTALSSLGYDDRDPAVKRGVEALIADAGFVRPLESESHRVCDTAYAEHALARLFRNTGRWTARRNEIRR
jgi:hypothetical protein